MKSNRILEENKKQILSLRGVNKENYASFEASLSLMAANIILETETVWIYARHIDLKSLKNDPFSWMLCNRSSLPVEATGKKPFRTIIPAPTMAEVWMELPEHTMLKQYLSGTEAFLGDIFFEDRNPADALIDLLIWIKTLAIPDKQ